MTTLRRLQKSDVVLRRATVTMHASMHIYEQAQQALAETRALLEDIAPKRLSSNEPAE